MPIVFGKAPGKIILFGEHAVVYGQPAIAIPVSKVNATARVLPNMDAAPGQMRIQALDFDLNEDLSNLPDDHPLAAAVQRTLVAVAPDHLPACTLQISSTIPVSAGMGSSAAISVAIIRALSAFLGATLSTSTISDLAYEVEKIHHGTPSGIDNNVIAYQQPVYFIRDEPIQFLQIKKPTQWVIADTGEKTPTRETVAAVRALHSADGKFYDDIFDQIGAVAKQARIALTNGDVTALGYLMNENQRLLHKLNVSSSRLDHLINAALAADAAGAKLSGGGCGGNMIALAPSERLTAIEQALIDAGAQRTITTMLAPGALT